MNLRFVLLSFVAAAVIGCSSGETKPPTTPAGEGGKVRMSQATCSANIQQHGKLCAQDDESKQVNAKMVEILCTEIETHPDTAAWVGCLTNVKTTEQCEAETAKCMPLFEKVPHTPKDGAPPPAPKG
jgi:hypothetical protein